MPAVSDSSPLILFSSIGRLALLKDIYSEVTVPPAVWQETVVRGAGRPGSSEIRSANWIRQVAPSIQTMSTLALRDLHPGETEAIALALTLQPRLDLILDDRPARLVAKAAGIEVIGTGGVLVLAKRLNLIDAVSPLLAELQAAGLYLSDSVVETFLSLAGE